VEHDNVPVICRACSKQVLMNQIKFDDARKAYVCQSCYNATHPATLKVQKKEFDTSKQESRKSVEGGMDKYNCPDCKYYFSRLKDKPVTSCPYCGSKKIIKASGKTADSVIEESRYFDF
jgi:DNA-directed RNA polymerase subunit RPC12/RpoP